MKIKASTMALFIAGLIASSAVAWADDGADVVKNLPSPHCFIRGYAIARDAGTIVRSAPNAEAPVIARLLPAFPPTKDNWIGPGFSIDRSSNGWLQIGAADSPPNAQGEVRRIFNGPGWVWGGDVGVALVGDPLLLRSEPRLDAPIIAQLSSANRGFAPGSLDQTLIDACTGEYVELTVKVHDAAPVRGWAYVFIP